MNKIAPVAIVLLSTLFTTMPGLADTAQPSATTPCKKMTPPLDKDGKPLPPPDGQKGEPPAPPTDKDGKPLPPPDGKKPGGDCAPPPADKAAS